MKDFLDGGHLNITVFCSYWLNILGSFPTETVVEQNNLTANGLGTSSNPFRAISALCGNVEGSN